jgi:kumamolisin
MARTTKRKTLTSSERKMLPNAKVVGKVDPEERIEITIMVRPRRTANVDLHTEAMKASAKLPEQRRYLTREEFAEQLGADPADFAKIEEFAHQHNLTVTRTSIPHSMRFRSCRKRPGSNRS